MLTFHPSHSTAGLYSTPADLPTFFRAILSSTLLAPRPARRSPPPAAPTTFFRAILSSPLLARGQTARWLKPSSLLAPPSQAVGMPWEIFRPTTATPDYRPVTLYTKSGNLPGYA